MTNNNSLHNARTMAADILRQCEETGLPVDQLRDEALDRLPTEDDRDRRLMMALVYGVLRQRSFLDWVLTKHSSHPLRKMKPLTLQTLRVALYQILFMDRIPDSAAINEAVSALKAARQPRWLTGFVNGLLRSVLTTKTDWIGLQTTNSTELAPPHVRLNHPEWLVRRWQDRYGVLATEAICQANNTQPSIVLRVNATRIARPEFLKQLADHSVSGEPGHLAPDSVILADPPPSIHHLPGYQEGWFLVQDQAAQLIPLLIGPLAQGAVLDGCAGLGGKTTQLATLLPPECELVAVEPHQTRVRLLHENLTRLGLLERVHITPITLQEYAQSASVSFQGILLDAPCSGLGVIRRHPEIRWNRRPDDLARYQNLQTTLLAAAAQLLAPGGVLVYATCSTEPEENEQVVHDFLGSHSEFSLSPCAQLLPEAARPFVDSNHFFRTVPNISGVDGFFAARLVKSS